MYSEPQSLDISAGDILQNALLLLLLLLIIIIIYIFQSDFC